MNWIDGYPDLMGKALIELKEKIKDSNFYEKFLRLCIYIYYMIVFFVIFFTLMKLIA